MTQTCARCGTAGEGASCSKCGAPLQPRTLYKSSKQQNTVLLSAEEKRRRRVTKPAAELPAALLERFELRDVLGEGGMGVVYRALQRETKTEVALKLTIADDPALRERFLSEGRILAVLRHPNIVRVIEAGEADGHLYLALEYVEGESLASRLRRTGAMEVAEAARIGQQIASGLSHAHRKGVLHRDLKPANVLLTADGTAKLADFGLGRTQGATRLTTAGTVLGTPGYMPPEIVKNEPLGPAADIYSLGAMLFEMFTGRLPYREQDVAGYLRAQARQDAPKPSAVRAGLDAAVDELVLRCLARDPAARYPDAEEAGAALARLAAAPKAAAASRPVGRYAVLTGVVSVALAGAAIGLMPSKAPPAPVAPAPPAAPAPAPPRKPPPPDPMRAAGLFDAGRSARGYSRHRNERDGSILLLIPAGEFEMGTRDGEPAEGPPHRVKVSPFLIGEREVTNEQFALFVKTKRYLTEAEYASEPLTWRHPFEPGKPNGGPAHPVVRVSYRDAQKYCEWAGLRLPSEAEWEKAGRGTTGWRYPWGDSEPTVPVGNFADARAKAKNPAWTTIPGYDDGWEWTAPAASFPAGVSPCGAFDLAGNASEWCADWFDADYYRESPAKDPRGPDGGRMRVVRGGSYKDTAAGVRATSRFFAKPGEAAATRGFRVARTVPR